MTTKSKLQPAKPFKESVSDFINRAGMNSQFLGNLLTVTKIHNLTPYTTDKIFDIIMGIPIYYRKSTNKLGSAHFNPRYPSEAKIRISTIPMTSIGYIDTVLHEISHVLVGLLYGTKKIKPHGREFALIATELGALPQATNNDVLFKQGRKSAQKPVARCTKCNYTHYRTRQHTDYWRKVICGDCNSPFEIAQYSKTKVHWLPAIYPLKRIARLHDLKEIVPNG